MIRLQEYTESSLKLRNLTRKHPKYDPEAASAGTIQHEKVGRCRQVPKAVAANGVKNVILNCFQYKLVSLLFLILPSFLSSYEEEINPDKQWQNFLEQIEWFIVDRNPYLATELPVEATEEDRELDEYLIQKWDREEKALIEKLNLSHKAFFNFQDKLLEALWLHAGQRINLKQDLLNSYIDCIHMYMFPINWRTTCEVASVITVAADGKMEQEGRWLNFLNQIDHPLFVRNSHMTPTTHLGLKINKRDPELLAHLMEIRKKKGKELITKLNCAYDACLEYGNCVSNAIEASMHHTRYSYHEGKKANLHLRKSCINILQTHLFPFYWRRAYNCRRTTLICDNGGKTRDGEWQCFLKQIDWYFGYRNPNSLFSFGHSETVRKDSVQEWNEYEKKLINLLNLSHEAFFEFRDKVADALTSDFFYRTYSTLINQKAKLDLTKCYMDREKIKLDLTRYYIYFLQKWLFPDNWRDLYDNSESFTEEEEIDDAGWSCFLEQAKWYFVYEDPYSFGIARSGIQEYKTAHDSKDEWKKKDRNLIFKLSCAHKAFIELRNRISEALVINDDSSHFSKTIKENVELELTNDYITLCILSLNEPNIRKMEITKTHCLNMMTERYPSFLPLLEAYLEDDDSDSSVTGDTSFWGAMSRFSRFIINTLSNECDHSLDLAVLFSFIEYLLVHGDEDVQNAVCTCFLENIMNMTPDKINPIKFIPYLGHESRKYCQSWDEFTGVKTEGL